MAEWADGALKYEALFESAPSLFHPKYPYEPSIDIPVKLDNKLGEYF